MTAPDDLIRRDTAERAIRALIDSPARGSDLHARGVVCGLVIAQESLAALPADPVAEAAEARVAELEAIQKIARVQVDDEGDMWLHLDGGENYKASVNVSAKVEHGGCIVRGGVRQAAEALRSLLAKGGAS